MRRFPVTAAKDMRAPAPLRPKADPWTGNLQRLSARQAECLLGAAATLCPHDWLAVDSYRSVILSIDRLASAKDVEIIRGGLPKLDVPFGLPFSALSDGNRIAVMKSLEGSTFFTTLLRLVTRYLYDLPEVWAGCGYDGVAGCGDGPRRDYDDATLSEGAGASS